MSNIFYHTGDVTSGDANRRAHDIKDRMDDLRAAHFACSNENWKYCVGAIVPLAALAPFAGWGVLLYLPASAYLFKKFHEGTAPQEWMMQERIKLADEFNRVKEEIQLMVPDARWDKNRNRFTSHSNPKALEF